MWPESASRSMPSVSGSGAVASVAVVVIALQPAVPVAQGSPLEAEQGVVVVSERGTGRFAQVVSAGRHQFVMDEPLSVGGDDQGPTPYDMLNAALGACTAMTVRMYARRKQWPLTSVRVALVHDKMHAADCEDCETREGKVDQIVRVVELQGELDEAQRARLIEIADRCPVHQTLHSEVNIVTRAGAL